jgi:hypothetical protein
MNVIAAHKDELERLLASLSRDAAVSGTKFAALLDAYITRLDTNCSDISARVDSTPAQTNWRNNLEPTLTQNCALYYAHHTTPKRRAALFRKFRVTARRHSLSTQRQMTRDELFKRLWLHWDNDR